MESTPSSLQRPKPKDVSTAALKIMDDIRQWLIRRVQRADDLEMRLDATLVSCYVLARFLVYDLATGMKTVPGWNIEDWVRILSSISSAGILAFWWTISGLFVTQSFEPMEGTDATMSSPSSSSSFSTISWMALTFANVLVAAPLWLVTENILHFGPPGMESYAYTTLVLFLTSSFGLALTMILAKTVTTGWR